MTQPLTVVKVADTTRAVAARRYADTRVAQRAFERAQGRLRPRDEVSVFRVQRPADGRHLVCLVGAPERVSAALRRAGIGGEPDLVSETEAHALAARQAHYMREAHASGARVVSDTIRRAPVAAVNLMPDGTVATRQRPQG